MRRPSVRSVRRQLKKALPVPFDLAVFLERVVALRGGRPIHIVDIDFSVGGGITGMWIPTARHDIILIPAAAQGGRRIAIICHELAHMFLQHEPNDLGLVGQDATKEILPMLKVGSAELVAKFTQYAMHRRHGYEQVPEDDAETVATELVAALIEIPMTGTLRYATNSLQW